jgi:hypothetical protein
VELIELIDNTFNVSGGVSLNCTDSDLIRYFLSRLDRENMSHFISFKKKNNNYLDSNGVISEMAKEVKDGSGDCVTFKNGSLHAAPCDIPAYYICENKYAETRWISNMTFLNSMLQFKV